MKDEGGRMKDEQDQRGPRGFTLAFKSVRVRRAKTIGGVRGSECGARLEVGPACRAATSRV